MWEGSAASYKCAAKELTSAMAVTGARMKMWAGVPKLSQNLMIHGISGRGASGSALISGGSRTAPTEWVTKS
ncbi:MAG: hypothetical protein AB1664_18165, partial [Thermodesulfobacteriota bacterium]